MGGKENLFIVTRKGNFHGDSKSPHAVENFLQLQISDEESAIIYGTIALSSETRHGTDEVYLMPKISPNSFV